MSLRYFEVVPDEEPARFLNDELDAVRSGVSTVNEPAETCAFAVSPESTRLKFSFSKPVLNGMLRVSVGYPSEDAEVAILARDGAEDAIPHLKPVASTAAVAALGTAGRGVHIAPGLQHYLVDLATAMMPVHHRTRAKPATARSDTRRAAIIARRGRRPPALFDCP